MEPRLRAVCAAPGPRRRTTWAPPAQGRRPRRRGFNESRACLRTYNMVPPESIDAYRAVREHAAMLDRSDRGRLIVSGADRAAYLHGLLTNDVASLTAGQGCYAAYLTPQGRMIADMFLYELGDIMLMTIDGSVKDTVLAKLDQFIFSEDVKLGDVSQSFAEVAVVGPDAAGILERTLTGVPAGALNALPVHGNRRAEFR